MKTFLIFALFSFSTAQAADALFLRVLSRLNNDGVLPQQTLACQAGGQNAELAQTCAIQLCGDSQSAPTAYITEARIEEWTRPELLARFSEAEEPLKKILNANIETARTALSNLKKRLASGPISLGADTPDADYESFAALWFQDLVSIDIDLEKPLEERLEYSTVKIPTHSRDIKAALQSYADAYVQDMKSDFGDACYNGLYSDEEAKAELKKRFEQFDARYQAALAQHPNLLAGSREELNELREKLSSRETIEAFDVGTFAYYLSFYDSQVASTTAQPELWPQVQNSKCKDEVCRKGLQELVAKTNWKKLAADLENRLADPKLLENQMLFCRSNFASLALKESETERIREALPRVKTQFMSRVAKNFSAHSREAFETYLNENLSFNFASDDESALDQFVEQVKISAEESKVVDSSTDAQLIKALSKIKNPYSDYVSVITDASCTGLGVSAWDSFMPLQPGIEDFLPADGDPTKDNLQISHFSCTHPAQGEQVLAHELGHALSQAFSDNELSESSYVEFMRLRSCVNGWADPSLPEAPVSFVSHEGDAIRTEEDTADLVAYMYAYDNPALMSCALLEPEITGNNYANASIANPTMFDSHSSPLTRAIREAMHKRLPIPAACQQLIGPESGMRFNTCF